MQLQELSRIYHDKNLTEDERLRIMSEHVDWDGGASLFDRFVMSDIDRTEDAQKTIQNMYPGAFKVKTGPNDFRMVIPNPKKGGKPFTIADPYWIDSGDVIGTGFAYAPEVIGGTAAAILAARQNPFRANAIAAAGAEGADVLTKWMTDAMTPYDIERGTFGDQATQSALDWGIETGAGYGLEKAFQGGKSVFDMMVGAGKAVGAAPAGLAKTPFRVAGVTPRGSRKHGRDVPTVHETFQMMADGKISLTPGSQQYKNWDEYDSLTFDDLQAFAQQDAPGPTYDASDPNDPVVRKMWEEAGHDPHGHFGGEPGDADASLMGKKKKRNPFANWEKEQERQAKAAERKSQAEAGAGQRQVETEKKARSDFHQNLETNFGFSSDTKGTYGRDRAQKEAGEGKGVIYEPNTKRFLVQDGNYDLGRAIGRTGSQVPGFRPMTDHEASLFFYDGSTTIDLKTGGRRTPNQSMLIENASDNDVQLIQPEGTTDVAKTWFSAFHELDQEKINEVVGIEFNGGVPVYTANNGEKYSPNVVTKNWENIDPSKTDFISDAQFRVDSVRKLRHSADPDIQNLVKREKNRSTSMAANLGPRQGFVDADGLDDLVFTNMPTSGFAWRASSIKQFPENKISYDPTTNKYVENVQGTLQEVKDYDPRVPDDYDPNTAPYPDGTPRTTEKKARADFHQNLETDFGFSSDAKGSYGRDRAQGKAGEGKGVIYEPNTKRFLVQDEDYDLTQVITRTGSQVPGYRPMTDKEAAAFFYDGTTTVDLDTGKRARPKELITIDDAPNSLMGENTDPDGTFQKAWHAKLLQVDQDKINQAVGMDASQNPPVYNYGGEKYQVNNATGQWENIDPTKSDVLPPLLVLNEVHADLRASTDPDIKHLVNLMENRKDSMVVAQGNAPVGRGLNDLMIGRPTNANRWDWFVSTKKSFPVGEIHFDPTQNIYVKNDGSGIKEVKDYDPRIPDDYDPNTAPHPDGTPRTQDVKSTVAPEVKEPGDAGGPKFYSFPQPEMTRPTPGELERNLSGMGFHEDRNTRGRYLKTIGDNQISFDVNSGKLQKRLVEPGMIHPWGDMGQEEAMMITTDGDTWFNPSSGRREPLPERYKSANPDDFFEEVLPDGNVKLNRIIRPTEEQATRIKEAGGIVVDDEKTTVTSSTGVQLTREHGSDRIGPWTTPDGNEIANSRVMKIIDRNIGDQIDDIPKFGQRAFSFDKSGNKKRLYIYDDGSIGYHNYTLIKQDDKPFIDPRDGQLTHNVNGQLLVMDAPMADLGQRGSPKLYSAPSPEVIYNQNLKDAGFQDHTAAQGYKYVTMSDGKSLYLDPVTKEVFTQIKDPMTLARVVKGGGYGLEQVPPEELVPMTSDGSSFFNFETGQREYLPENRQVAGNISQSRVVMGDTPGAQVNMEANMAKADEDAIKKVLGLEHDAQGLKFVSKKGEEWRPEDMGGMTQWVNQSNGKVRSAYDMQERFENKIDKAGGLGAITGSPELDDLMMADDMTYQYNNDTFKIHQASGAIRYKKGFFVPDGDHVYNTDTGKTFLVEDGQLSEYLGATSPDLGKGGTWASNIDSGSPPDDVLVQGSPEEAASQMGVETIKVMGKPTTIVKAQNGMQFSFAEGRDFWWRNLEPEENINAEVIQNLLATYPKDVQDLARLAKSIPVDPRTVESIARTNALINGADPNFHLDGKTGEVKPGRPKNPLGNAGDPVKDPFVASGIHKDQRGNYSVRSKDNELFYYDGEAWVDEATGNPAPGYKVQKAVADQIRNRSAIGSTVVDAKEFNEKTGDFLNDFVLENIEQLDNPLPPPETLPGYVEGSREELYDLGDGKKVVKYEQKATPEEQLDQLRGAGFEIYDDKGEVLSFDPNNAEGELFEFDNGVWVARNHIEETERVLDDEEIAAEFEHITNVNPTFDPKDPMKPVTVHKTDIIQDPKGAGGPKLYSVPEPEVIRANNLKSAGFQQSDAYGSDLYYQMDDGRRLIADPKTNEFWMSAADPQNIVDSVMRGGKGQEEVLPEELIELTFDGETYFNFETGKREPIEDVVTAIGTGGNNPTLIGHPNHKSVIWKNKVPDEDAELMRQALGLENDETLKYPNSGTQRRVQFHLDQAGGFENIPGLEKYAGKEFEQQGRFDRNNRIFYDPNTGSFETYGIKDMPEGGIVFDKDKNQLMKNVNGELEPTEPGPAADLGKVPHGVELPDGTVLPEGSQLAGTRTFGSQRHADLPPVEGTPRKVYRNDAKVIDSEFTVLDPQDGNWKRIREIDIKADRPGFFKRMFGAPDTNEREFFTNEIRKYMMEAGKNEGMPINPANYDQLIFNIHTPKKYREVAAEFLEDVQGDNIVGDLQENLYQRGQFSAGQMSGDPRLQAREQKWGKKPQIQQRALERAYDSKQALTDDFNAVVNEIEVGLHQASPQPDAREISTEEVFRRMQSGEMLYDTVQPTASPQTKGTAKDVRDSIVAGEYKRRSELERKRHHLIEDVTTTFNNDNYFVDLNNFKTTLENIDLTKLDARAQTALGDAIELLGGNMEVEGVSSFKQAMDARNALWNMMETDSDLLTAADREVGKVFDSLNRSIRNQLDNMLKDTAPDSVKEFGIEAYEEYDRLVNFEKRHGPEFQFSKNLLEGRDSQEIVDILLQGSSKGGRILRSTLQSMDENSREALRVNLLKHIGYDAQGDFNGARFVENWNNLNPDAKRQLVQDEKHVEHLDKISRVAGIAKIDQYIEAYQQGTKHDWIAAYLPMILGTGTGGAFSYYVLGTGPIGTAAGATAGYVAPKVMWRLLTSKPFAKWLADAAPAKPKWYATHEASERSRREKFASHVGRLAGLAASNEYMKDEILEYAQAVSNLLTQDLNVFAYGTPLPPQPEPQEIDFLDLTKQARAPMMEQRERTEQFGRIPEIAEQGVVDQFFNQMLMQGGYNR